MTETIETPLTETELLAGRLSDSLIGGMELLSIELGRKLGAYTVLALEPITADAFAGKVGIPERYAIEWLSQQVAAGLVRLDDDGYVLPETHVPVLVDDESPAFALGFAPLLLGTALTLPSVVTAYATGTGVGYDQYGTEFREGIAMTNRPQFVHELTGWLDHLPEVSARLATGGVVLDAGCGSGWSTIALAKAFPQATIIGVDLDEGSIADAQRHVDAAGLGYRIELICANVLDEQRLRAAAPNGYELITVFEALHDMGEPDLALAGFRRLLAQGGEVLVGDDHGGEDPNDPAERLNRVFSALHCTPATWAESDRVVNGTVLRPHAVSDWALAAGFTDVEHLAIEHPFWWFYRVS